MKSIYISVNEFAAMLGVGRTKAYELLSNGTVQSTTLGRRRLVLRKSAQAFARSLLGEECGQ
jgi:excisionase family DNA binding protein